MPHESLRATLLGTGTSTGVPIIGCDCRVCQSDDPRDDRTRTSAYVEVNGLGIVIDTGPDFRRQALRERIDRVDAVLNTHHHFDHVVGLDDLRPFFFHNRNPIPFFARPNAAKTLRRSFPYIFGDERYPTAPRLMLHPVKGSFTVESRYDEGTSVEVTPIPAMHGDLPIYGYRIGDFAYVTDTSHLSESSLELLSGVRLLVLGALRHRAHPTHFCFDQAEEVARRVGADETYFIHMTHSVLHSEVEAELPPTMHLAYDGLRLEVPHPEMRCAS